MLFYIHDCTIIDRRTVILPNFRIRQQLINKDGVATYHCVLNMQNIELPSPYGDCEASEGYMQSKCLTDCVANYVIKNCSCKDTYMPGENKIYLKQQASSPFPPFLFWAFVCKTVRPIVSDRCLSVLSVLSALSVCDVGVLWSSGWMHQDETWRAGRLRPRTHYVRWGPSFPPKGDTVPNFRPMTVVSK